MTGMLSKISVTATPEASGKKNFRLIPLEDNWLGQWTRLDGSGSGRQAGRQAERAALEDGSPRAATASMAWGGLRQLAKRGAANKHFSQRQASKPATIQLH